MKYYKVMLSQEESESLHEIIRKGKGNAAMVRRANVLRGCDEGPFGLGWTDEAISQAYGMSTRQIERLRKRLVEEGFELSLKGHPRAARPVKFDGHVEAHLIALTCQQPPQGCSQWTLQLLADRMIALEYVDSMSYESVRRILKKRLKAVEKDALGDSARSGR